MKWPKLYNCQAQASGLWSISVQSQEKISMVLKLKCAMVSKCAKCLRGAKGQKGPLIVRIFSRIYSNSHEQRMKEVSRVKSATVAKGARVEKVPRVPGFKRYQGCLGQQLRRSTWGQGLLKKSSQIEPDS